MHTLPTIVGGNPPTMNISLHGWNGYIHHSEDLWNKVYHIGCYNSSSRSPKYQKSIWQMEGWLLPPLAQAALVSHLWQAWLSISRWWWQSLSRWQGVENILSRAENVFTECQSRWAESGSRLYMYEGLKHIMTCHDINVQEKCKTSPNPSRCRRIILVQVNEIKINQVWLGLWCFPTNWSSLWRSSTAQLIESHTFLVDLYHQPYQAWPAPVEMHYICHHATCHYWWQI